MINKALQELELTHGISRAIYWNSKCEMFCARAYSSTTVASKANAEFKKIKESYTNEAN